MGYVVLEVGGHEVTVHSAPADGRAHEVDKMVRTGDNLTYVTKFGKLCSTRVGPGHWYVGRRWTTGKLDLVRDLIALGAVNGKKEVARIVAAEKSRQVRRHKASAAADVLSQADVAGIKLTDVQTMLLKRAVRNGKRA